MKIHCFDKSTNKVCCNSSQGNGSCVEVEQFKKMMQNNDVALCSKCQKYLKGPMGKKVK